MKKIGVCFFALQVLLLAQCDMFHTSLEDYLNEIPKELRIRGLRIRATSPAGSFTPLEALDKARSDYTIVATPGSTGYTWAIELEDPSSFCAVMSFLAPPARPAIPPAMLPAGLTALSLPIYRPNETHILTIQTANGMKKNYTITVIWAKLIDSPSEIGSTPADLAQDYYLRPGPPITLNNGWVPIGYPATSFFNGSLRGNGRTIIINSFASTTYDSQGLFGYLNNALIEDLHVRLNSVSAAPRNYAGGIAGHAQSSLIQRVRVSGNLHITTPILSGSFDVGGIAGHLTGEALIYNSVSAVNVSVAAPSYTHEPYIGGINGAIDTIAGGNIANCYATGTIDGTGHANTRAGGISGGGGNLGTLKVQNCVARNDNIIGHNDQTNYVSAQWAPGTIMTGNIYWVGTNITGSPPAPPSYATVPSYPPFPGFGGTSTAQLADPATYTGMGWDFITVWKMGSNGLPALRWE
jgi:hypothetical protein